MTRNGSAVRVAFVSQPSDLVYPPVQASIPGLTVHLSRELARLGFDVTVYAPRKDARLAHAVVDGVRYSYVSERGSGFLNRAVLPLSRLHWSRRLPLHASVLNELRYTLEVALRIRFQQAQIVHVHNFTSFVPVIRAFNPGARFVLNMHCEWLSQLDAEVMSHRVAITHLVLGCSHYITDKIRAAFPGRNGGLDTLLNGVDTGFFTPAADDPVVEGRPYRLLFVGRVSPEKGVHDLVDAFAQLAHQIPDIELNIVGPAGAAPREYIVDVSDDDNVRALARFYNTEAESGIGYLEQLRRRLPPGLETRVNFVGPASRETLREQYRNADVSINPSLSESFGITVAEAMACGTPVVATRVGGMVDIVRDGETGLLVPPASPEDLAGAIGRMLEDAPSMRAMGRRGRERAVSLFSWETVGAQLASAYESLISDTRV